MTFVLLPAVDVADGRTARVRADTHDATTSSDPRDAALSLQAGGADWIHLVDLDAAFGRGSNAELLASVVGELDVEVELAGGIVDDASLDRALSTGCRRVVLATGAQEDPGWCERVIAEHGGRIAVGLDVRVGEDPHGSRRHRLAPRGSTRDLGELWEALDRLDRAGCARYVVTDVSRDGTLDGPNVELYREVTSATAAPVVASGGISSIGDLVALAEVAAAGANLEGSILGTALHAGRFTVPEAREAVRRVV